MTAPISVLWADLNTTTHGSTKLILNHFFPDVEASTTAVSKENSQTSSFWKGGEMLDE